MYRTIDARFWTDPKVKTLPTQAKLLFLYLITNPHTHVSGIYYLSRSVIFEETGIPKSSLDTFCDYLSSIELVKFDRERSIVWVVNMMGYQGKGDKNARSAAFHIKEDLHGSFLVREFLEKYPSVKKHIPEYPIDTLSREKPAVPLLNPESSLLNPKPEDCSEVVSAPTSEPPSVFLVFPCSGEEKDPKTWDLTEAKIFEYLESFPGIDVRAECRKALQWCRDNPGRVKTAKGMPRFLGRWLSKAQDALPVVAGRVHGGMTHDGLRRFLEKGGANGTL